MTNYEPLLNKMTNSDTCLEWQITKHIGMLEN